MTSPASRPSRSGGRQSHFYRDIASPIPSHRAKFVTPGQAAAVSALWKDNFGATDLPPPPVFTLDDRADFSPDTGLGDLPLSPSPSPVPAGGRETPGSGSWWSPGRSEGGEEREKEKGSPVDGVVENGALVVLPSPREVVRPEVQRSSVLVGDLDEEEWVTVYGFSPADTNLVLREFEKCGLILRHVFGPRDANWMHILYQSRYDAQKAMAKDGLQLNNALIVGVKPLDPMQRQFLNEKLNQGGFMNSCPSTLAGGTSASALGSLKPSAEPLKYQSTTGNMNANGRPSDGAIARPVKSVFSKAMDLMFGL